MNTDKLRSVFTEIFFLDLKNNRILRYSMDNLIITLRTCSVIPKMIKTRARRILFRTKRFDIVGYKLWLSMLVVVVVIQCLQIYWMESQINKHIVNKSDNFVKVTLKVPEPIKIPEQVHIKHDFEKLKKSVSRKCRMMTSPWVDHLIQPDLVSNMADWNFVHKRECPHLSLNDLPVKRSKFSLLCYYRNALIDVSETYNSSEIFELDFRDSCLTHFIDKCCVDDNPVPNVVHYVWYGDKELEYFNFLSLMSVLRFVKPCVILIHGPTVPHGPYWEYFLHMSPNVIHVRRERPETVFGNKLRFKEHSSDVMRLEALIEYGGIYLDFDEVLLRPIDSLRRFQHTQGHELKRTMGSQVVMSKKNATFLNLWYKSYRDDYKKIWAYNALWVPNTLAKNHPELIHVEGFNFTRPNWQNTKMIYDGNYKWATNYGMHMYARWYRRPINLDIIRTLNTTIGAVSRHILFGNKELCRI